MTTKIEAQVETAEFRKTGNYHHHLTHHTPGFGALDNEDRQAIMLAFYKAERGDHHYTINYGDVKVFICENGEGYTAMLPEEY